MIEQGFSKNETGLLAADVPVLKHTGGSEALSLPMDLYARDVHQPPSTTQVLLADEKPKPPLEIPKNSSNWLEEFISKKMKPLDILAFTFTVGAAAFLTYVFFGEPILGAATSTLLILKRSRLVMAAAGYLVSFSRKQMHATAQEALKERWEIFKQRWLRKKPKKEDVETETN